MPWRRRNRLMSYVTDSRADPVTGGGRFSQTLFSENGHPVIQVAVRLVLYIAGPGQAAGLVWTSRRILLPTFNSVTLRS
jgi:hypothetical protein